ncbi:hypothetical protein NQ314_011573 [Rhamnusium bicolor]|uniref:Variable lymphocyte receptor A n=1 Tax=Rhamnusium bicolor TaxID=1586634 RepID=A0AAV8XGZ6_9CUCU|nr:hypothetical protein NQ314_011573 [Rhamnusium bicolor]
MKYFVLLAALISATESGCPSMCTCSDSSVLCIEKDLESIPSFESLINDPIIIDLSGNKINMVDSDDFSFDKSDKVKEIYLNNTELLDIDSEAFDELENLQELYLGDNLLNSIPENLIQDLLNMILLDISNNHFSGNMPKIISHSLEVLAVANSKVTDIPINSLKYLPNLKMLLLQQNNIKSIDPAVFEGVNKNSFFVRLSYNVWDCSCENIELFEYLAGKKFIDTSDPYQCLTNSGKYINVYSKGTIEDIRNKCSNNELRGQITKELTSFKENRLMIEAGELLREEEMLEVKNPDKPYSLVRDNNTMNEADEAIEITDVPESIVVDGNEEQDILLEDDDDILVKDIHFTKEKGVEITEYEDSIEPTFTFDINISVFIAILCSFVIGVIFGFCVNQFATALRHQSLETSDSRTKLILP